MENIENKLILQSDSISLIFENKEIEKAFNDNPYKFIYYLALKDNAAPIKELEYFVLLSKFVLKTISFEPNIEFVREDIELTFQNEDIENLFNERPFIEGSKFLTIEWITDFLNKSLLIYKEEIKEFKGTVESYFTKNSKDFHLANRIYFHLVENKSDEIYPFAFLVTYSNSKEKHVPLDIALKEYKGKTKELISLISPIIKISEKNKFIKSILDSKEIYKAIKIKPNEAYLILKDIPLFEKYGVYCRVPNFWKRKSKSRISYRVSSNNKTKLGFDSILSFSPEIIFNNQKFSREEINELLKIKEGLRFIKGEWVEVDHAQLKEVLKHFDNLDLIKEGNLAKSLSLSIGSNEEEVDISYDDYINNLLNGLKNPKLLDKVNLPKNFLGKLRPYQYEGFLYLTNMYSLNLCPCLADDMGLGKTIQIISFISSIFNKNKSNILLILPASLIGNWQIEFKKFFPSIAPIEINKEIEIKKGNVYLTTYALSKKLKCLKSIDWDILILDEAQAIKNSSTIQARYINSLKSKFRIALTGTPIENSLSDLYSIFNFLNPGMLGNRKEFAELSDEMEKNKSYKKLRDLLSIFILRRLKTDKSIISDLPDKVVKKEYPSLTEIQARLYKNVIDELEEKIANQIGINRKGIILSTILKLKQICNHPDEYSGGGNFSTCESGKFMMLNEIAQTIVSHGERMIVFTQFKELIPALDNLLTKTCGSKGLIIDGSTPKNKRTEIVEKFNSPFYIPYIILSLKAGGVGLNLTAANHVIHFDRWWNPAVENQASDRSYRIGQKKNVVIHIFINKGTIEEKIDKIIEEKSSLADSILSSTGELKLSELSNKEIIELCSLKEY